MPSPKQSQAAPGVPPPGLLGACLLLWGYLAPKAQPSELGHLAYPLAILAALVVEGHRFIRWRAKLTDDDYVRVWNVCVALVLLVGVFRMVSLEMWNWDMTRHFQLWLPFLMLPMIFVQLYNQGDRIPIITFSIIARHKRALDQRAGREVLPPERIHLGYFYLGLLFLSLGSLARYNSFNRVPHFEWILGFLVAWALWPVIPKRRYLAAAFAFALALFLARNISQAHIGLQRMVDNQVAKLLGKNRGKKADDFSQSSIGDLGQIKLSSKIAWRLQSLTGQPPAYLCENVFTDYAWGIWRTVPGAKDRHLKREDGDSWRVFQLPTSPPAKIIRLRGKLREERSLLPIPQNTGYLHELPALELHRYPLGQVLIVAEQAAIDTQIVYGELGNGSDGFPFEPNPGEPDLRPSKSFKKQGSDGESEDEILARLASNIAPNSASAKEKIEALRGYFRANGFRYSLSPKKPRNGRSSFSAAYFLTESKEGHCEYFATATTLLLRKLGVPARYVVGYSVQERDPETKEYLLRDLHRHAWALAWDGGRWVQVDTTPPDWASLDKPKDSWWRRFQDRWSRWMLEWSLWRHRDDKGLLWKLLPLFLAIGLFAVVTFRLVRGFRQRGKQRHSHSLETAPCSLGVDSDWYQMESILGAQYEARLPAETARAWSLRLRHSFPQLPTELEQVLNLHYRYRFDPSGLDEDQRLELRQGVESILRDVPKAASQG